MMLLFTDPNRNVGGAKGCLLSKIKKVGGAIAPPAPPAPPVPAPLKKTLERHLSFENPTKDPHK